VRGDILSKIGPIALFISLTLLTGLGYAADKIALTCSGTLWIKGSGQGDLQGQSIIIDPDQGIVTMGYMGNFPITGSTETNVGFKGSFEDGDILSGWLDRYSGSAVVERLHNEEITWL